jgi:hypothetical protein
LTSACAITWSISWDIAIRTQEVRGFDDESSPGPRCGPGFFCDTATARYFDASLRCAASLATTETNKSISSQVL